MKQPLNVDQIRKLWILDLIVQTGSLKAAAAKAKITPSAVSQALTSLESRVGQPLAIRDKGAVRPSARALAILATVRPAFEAFERLEDLDDQPLPKMTWLNFGTYESIAVDILPGMIETLHRKMPNRKLGLRIARTGSLLTMVRKGELCSAVITEVEDLGRFFKIKVGDDRLGVYIAARHPLAGKGWDAVGTVGLGSLIATRDGMPRYFTRFQKRLGAVKPSVVSESFETLRAAAAAGAIAAVLPHHVAMRLPGELIEITPDGDERSNGGHGIYVVSQSSCDHDETRFIADETRRLLVR